MADRLDPELFAVEKVKRAFIWLIVVLSYTYIYL